MFSLLPEPSLRWELSPTALPGSLTPGQNLCHTAGPTQLSLCSEECFRAFEQGLYSSTSPFPLPLASPRLELRINDLSLPPLPPLPPKRLVQDLHVGPGAGIGGGWGWWLGLAVSGTASHRQPGALSQHTRTKAQVTHVLVTWISVRCLSSSAFPAPLLHPWKGHREAVTPQ